MTEIVAVVLLKAHEGKAAELLEAFTPVIEQTHGEEGCLAYALHRDLHDPDSMVLVERWASQEALDAHFQMPYMAAVGEAAGTLLTEPPRIVFSEPVPIGKTEKGSL